MTVVDPDFWLKLFLLLVIVGVLLFIFNNGMRKVLQVERKQFFSYNHLNQQHKKMDWTIRITFLVLILFGYIVNVSMGPKNSMWFLETYVLLFVFIIASETARAYMEWKYAENRRAYIFTISQLVFIILILLTLFITDFFGLFGSLYDL